MQLPRSAALLLLLLILILLLISWRSVGSKRDHEQDHDQEQEEELRSVFGPHDRDFFHNVGHSFAQAPAPDITREEHFNSGC
jgi:hypothetical protein